MIGYRMESGRERFSARRPVASAFQFLLALILVVLCPCLGGALERHPLAPPKTDSPRSTFAYFMDRMHRAYQINLQESYRSAEARDNIMKAARCLDLSDVAPADLQDVSIETALLLKEVLDRIAIPPLEEIPDDNAMQSMKNPRWRIPNTKITIHRIDKGPRQEEFLFGADTVARAREFYERVKALPYKRGASVGAYEDYIYSPGTLISNRFIRGLPAWTKYSFFDQALWQWIAWAGLLISGGLLVLLIFHRLRDPHHDDHAYRASMSWRELISPLALVLITKTVGFLIDEQINITGHLLDITKRILRAFLFFGACWFIVVVGNGITEAVIKSTRLRPKGIDANLARLIFKLLTWVILLVLIWNVSDYVGISLTAVFASAGIAGIALALAARETIANFFGGISILLDRPFKAGDYIVLDSGERGEVLEVGMRSTRIITRDDVQIAIPNSVITNTKVVNESAPYPRFRIKIKVGVAYGADPDKVEAVLMRVVRANHTVAAVPEPRVRFRAFGDSALDFELLCWARRPHDKGLLVHELNCSIFKAFDEEGIEIPFPQRDVHIRSNTSGSTSIEG